MKVELEICKKGRKCSYCGENIMQGEKFIQTTDWHPGMKFTFNKNVCFDCLKVRIENIRPLEQLLADLRLLERSTRNII